MFANNPFGTPFDRCTPEMLATIYSTRFMMSGEGMNALVDNAKADACIRRRRDVTAHNYYPADNRTIKKEQSVGAKEVRYSMAVFKALYNVFSKAFPTMTIEDFEYFLDATRIKANIDSLKKITDDLKIGRPLSKYLTPDQIAHLKLAFPSIRDIESFIDINDNEEVRKEELAVTEDGKSVYTLNFITC
jgi:uncharacterized protein with gpF-like domain